MTSPNSDRTYLRFSGDAPLIHTVVGLGSIHWCNHVDFVLPSGYLLGAFPGKGVVVRQPPTPPERECDLLLPAQELYCSVDVEGGYRSAQGQIGKPYDWTGLLPRLGCWEKPRSAQWHSSGLVTLSLFAAGADCLKGYCAPFRLLKWVREHGRVVSREEALGWR